MCTCSRLLIPVLVLVLSGASFGRQVDSATSAAESAELIDEAIDQVLRSSEATRIALAAIPRAGFDRAALLEQIGPSVEAIHRWVRDETRWVPYHGALRGPRGTQMEQVGNALDRALLLADLLEGAGHHVRLARAELDPETAASLWTELESQADEDAARPTPEPLGFDANARSQVAEILGLDAAAMQQSNRAAAMAAQQQIEDALGRIVPQAARLTALVGVPDSPQASERRAVSLEVLRDHWWVQLQTGEGWTDLDPASPSHTVGQVLAEARETFELDSLPRELEHLLRIELKVERLEEGRLKASTVLSEEISPRELLGQALMLQIAPIANPARAGRDGAAPLEDQLSSQKEWLPILVIGDRTIFQSSFRLSGEVVTDPSLNAGHRKLDGASDLFGSMGASEPRSILSRVWIEYTISAPERSSTIERVLYDLLDAEKRMARPPLDPPSLGPKARLERALTLLSRTEILPLTGHLSSAWVTCRVLEQQLANRLPSLGILQAAKERDADALTTQLANYQALPTALYTLALARDAWSLHTDALYQDGINVLTSHEVLERSDDGQVSTLFAMDIVSNRVEVMPFSGVDPWQARLAQGVVDTNAEALVISGIGKNVEHNAAEDHRTDLARGVDWIVVRSKGGPAWNAARWTSSQRAQVAAEIAAGYAVIAPPETQGRPFSYWRMDLATGTCLGVDARGWGSAECMLYSAPQEGAERLSLHNVSLRVAVWAHKNKDRVKWFCMACALTRRLLSLFVPGIPSELAESPCVLTCMALGVTGAWI